MSCDFGGATRQAVHRCPVALQVADERAHAALMGDVTHYRAVKGSVVLTKTSALKATDLTTVAGILGVSEADLLAAKA